MRWAFLAALLGACSGHPESRELPPDTVVAKTDTMLIKTGKIGLKHDSRDGTYVLVDVVNGSAEPRLVSMDGVLLDGQSRELAPLSVDELYLPAGEHRAFALVHGRVISEAASAKVRVRGAKVATRVPDVEVVAPNVRTEDGVLVAAPLYRNPTNQPALATVIAAFYDDKDRILARPFSVLPLAGQEVRRSVFRGPPGAATAVVYVGEVVF